MSLDLLFSVAQFVLHRIVFKAGERANICCMVGTLLRIKVAQIEILKAVQAANIPSILITFISVKAFQIERR